MQSVRLSLVGKYSKNFNNFVFTRDTQSHQWFIFNCFVNYFISLVSKG
jgi:hypothetical protein